MNKKDWTDIEIELLQNNFPIKTNEELIKFFPNRTYFSIKNKAKRLKLRKNKETEFKNRSIVHKGDKNEMFGKISSKNGKTYNEYYGKEKSHIIKNKISKDKINKFKNGTLNINGSKNGMFGKIPHNKGVEATPEQKKKTSDSIKNYWKNLSPEKLDERKNQLRKDWIKKVFKYNISDSKPEKIFESFLFSKKILFKKKIQIGFYNCDFIINDKYIIEVQGDYWHANPKFYSTNIDNIQSKNIRRDKAKLTYLNNQGYFVLYLWEDDILNNLNLCENKLNEFLYGKLD